MEYICNNCGKTKDIEKTDFICQCGGSLRLNRENISFKIEDINKDMWSMFRYEKAIPLEKKYWEGISLGEGMTPIVKNKEVMFKMDYLMPTASFKDRGGVLVVAQGKKLGAKYMIQDSSGNAGNSIAAYATRANIDCEIYVPKNTSENKINMIKSYGAKVNIVDGDREATAKEAREVVSKNEFFYASHVYNPFFYEGTKTYLYEIFEQMEYKLPDILFVPTGNGTYLIGTYYGLMDLKKSGYIDKYPKIIAVQSENCAPIYEAFINNKKVEEVVNKGTDAEGIAIANPFRGNEILRMIKEIDGNVIIAPEDKILKAKEQLAMKGFYVEPTTAAVYAAYKEYRENNYIDNKKILIPLCGSGLKKS